MKKLFSLVAFAIISLSSMAVTPLWLRDVQISPDGQQIVFCYKGDIYKIGAQGGTAVQLTTQDSYECNPIWSPDGKQIAFASDRNGNLDIYVMSSEGGSAKCLTTNSAAETPWTFSHDGKYVLFSATIQDPATSAMFPRAQMTELYQVPAAGGRTTQVLGTPAEMVHFSKDGSFFLYQDQKGFEDQWRKHQISSVSRDIWQYNVKTEKHTNLTNRAGEDRNPVIAPDGQTVYFLSERNKGSFNVYSFKLGNAQNAEAITSFKDHPVRFLSIAGNGTLCYTFDGEIYTQMANGQPKKVSIALTRDDENLPIDLRTSSGARSASVSPDGKEIVFAYRGEIFVTSVEYKTTKQITHTAANETSPVFGNDSRTLVYVSERDGHWNLYEAKISRKDDPNFANATLIEEKALFPGNDGIERTYPTFSPDGKELAFIENRRQLKVMNLESKKVRTITDGSKWPETSGGFSYDWSPDSKWFAIEFIGNKRDPYADIGLVSANGGPITNLTNSGYIDGSPMWVMDGNAILYESNRYGMRSHASWGSQNDAMMVFVNQDAYDKYRLSKEDYELLKELEKEQKKEAGKSDEKSKNDEKKGDKNEANKDEIKPINVELNGIEDRIVRVTPNSSNMRGMMIDKDGENLYYFASFEDGYDLWKMDLRMHETDLISKNAGPGSMQMDKEGKSIFILGGRLQKLDPKSDKLKRIDYEAEMKMDLAAEREYMFNRVYQQVKVRLFDPKIAFADWEKMTTAYRKFLPHISNNYDFQELLSEWLGELNVSHSGGRYSPQLGGDQTATLGLLYDWTYTGKGLKVDEIVENGPFDHANSKVKAGSIVEKIDGIVIDENTNYNSLLNGKTNKKTLVSLYDPQTKEHWDEVVLPIQQSALTALLYKRWVKQRAADVEKWSNGRLGYVHIESMGDASYRTIYSDILGKFNQKEGIVIDTRFNGGGRLHEDIQVLFSGSKYLTQVIRGEEACDMPSRRWNKPSIMIQCEANYSNAHGTPWVYKHENIGKLVGMPVPGTMSSVMWETLQDPTLVFGVPVIGYRTEDGKYLENTQLEPDIQIANSPDTIVKGIDTQLKTAVDELLKEIDSKK
ncbi:MAG: peptidase S41 [Bacteroidaceae bacterium]|nr:peptidase S41 [Bacteroidaceae bacterium]